MAKKRTRSPTSRGRKSTRSSITMRAYMKRRGEIGRRVKEQQEQSTVIKRIKAARKKNIASEFKQEFKDTYREELNIGSNRQEAFNTAKEVARETALDIAARKMGRKSF